MNGKACKIYFSEKIKLDPERKNTFQDILQRMFPDHQRVVVEKEFVSDAFSGSWVFLVHLVGHDNRPNLPVVVKIASASLIEKEWQAYDKYIRGKWPKTAAVRGEPVLTPDGTLSGLYYFLEGHGIFPVKSLRSYCLDETTTVEEIQEVLQRFSRVIVEGVLLYADNALKFRLGASYDRVLPINLLIKPVSLAPDVEPIVIMPLALPVSPLEPGSYVRLEDFVVTKIDPRKYTVTLNLACSTDHLPDDSYRVRLKFESGEAMPAYTMGQTVPAVEGQVLQTRYSQWQAEMEKVMADQGFGLDGETVFLPDGTGLPNPFVALRDILDQFRNIKVCYIHGDLNLGNIVVDPKVRDVCLIDFAEARRDHVLHDFLRLEIGVVTKLITPALVEAGLPVETICRFYEQLHCATFHSDQSTTARSPHRALDKSFAILKVVRQVARDHGLFNRNECAEYYHCLILYLLGALKFGDLNRKLQDPKPWPKQVAFWGAAAAQKLLQEPPLCEEDPIQQAHFFICYKRNADPDQKLANYLHDFLTDRGHSVFIDGSLRTGEAWLEEIDRQIKASDFLVVLLSKESADSEMMQAEIRRAYQYRKLQGHPHTLPVRIAYEGLLPYTIDAFLDPLQYVVWHSEADNERVAQDILAAIEGPLPKREQAPIQARPAAEGCIISEDGRPIADDDTLHSPLPEFDPRFLEELEAPGGAVRLRDKFYIERSADVRLKREIVKSGTTTTIRAARQTGKTSLLVRGVHYARQNGAQVVTLDLQRVDRDHLETPDVFLHYLAEFVVRKLRLDVAEVEKWWRSSLGPQDKLTYLIEDYVLPESDAPIVLAMDEVDRLLKTNFHNDFFALLRSWHNSRAFDDRWNKLNIVMVISTEPDLLITDGPQSPFNVGLRLYLEDFSEAQVRDLNWRHGSPVKAGDFPQLMGLLSGHPYLTRKAFYTLVTERRIWADLMRVAATDQGPFSDHLRHHDWLLRDEPDLREMLKQIILHNRCPDEMAFFRLLRAGLVKGSREVCKCRCDLYRIYFEDKL